MIDELVESLSLSILTSKQQVASKIEPNLSSGYVELSLFATKKRIRNAGKKDFYLGLLFCALTYHLILFAF